MKELTKQIETHLSELSLKAITASYKDLAVKASKSKLTYEEYLALLLETEVTRKKESSIHSKLIKSKFSA
jgi:RecG-like helicase